VIGLPPSESGAVNVTVAPRSRPTATTPVGAPGTALGVTGGADADGPAPTSLRARSRIVYAVPLVRSPTDDEGGRADHVVPSREYS
jgi:hypothetical protein